MDNSPDGNVRPRTRAVLRLTTNWNLANCITGRLLALKDATRVNPHLPIGIGETGAIAHQSARERELALLIGGRHSMARRPKHDLVAP